MKEARRSQGLLLVDKPVGLSSASVVHKVKRRFNLTKVGHTGTLDPFATGMLPLCIGESAKFSQYLLDADKGYIALACLGEETTTGDREGDLIKKNPLSILSQAKLDATLNCFLGPQQQVPPMFSALKHQGKPLYVLARAGQTVERAPRSIQIHELTCLEYSAPYLKLFVSCSKGTYIRTLLEDIGTMLGTGAHLVSLERVFVTPYQNNTCLPLSIILNLNYNELEPYIRPIETMLGHIPPFLVNLLQAKALWQGKVINNGLTQHTEPGLYRLVIAENNHFIGLGIIDMTGTLLAKRMLAPQEL